jgi:hypothetical protein
MRHATFRLREISRDFRTTERGSALVVVVFALALLSSLGVALLFLSQNEVRMSRANLQASKAFYLAEAGLEDGRATLYEINKGGDLSDDLATAAGPNGRFDIDPEAVRPVYDAAGKLTGFTGYGDDVPVTSTTAIGEGWYAVFLTNDLLEEATPLADANKRVMLTGVGAGPDRSFEVVQAVVEFDDILPSLPPATITLLGPDPVFEGGMSVQKEYTGDDCDGAGGIPGLYVPVVGTVDTVITDGMNRENNYTTDSGSYRGYGTAADVTDDAALDAMGSGVGALDPSWTDCAFLRDMIERIRTVADVVCEPPAECTLPPYTPDRVMFIDGDFELDPSLSGQGLLVVTGTLAMHGRTSWSGLILVIGEGAFNRYGAGNGEISGAVLVADIAGPDNVYGTPDDCSSGVDGFSSAVYDERGGGNGDISYCTDAILPALPVPPYEITSFVQR